MGLFIPLHFHRCSFLSLLLCYCHLHATTTALNHHSTTTTTSTRREAIIQSVGKIITGAGAGAGAGAFVVAGSSLSLPSNANANALGTTVTKNSISSRMTTDLLTIPSPSYASEFNGIDNLYYPFWMEGEWSVVQTLVNVSTPLGIKYLGGPNGIESIATDTLTEVRKQLDKPVYFHLKYRKTKWGVAEDRLFNTRQRLDAFAGRSVVANVQYADVGGSNRPTVLTMGGTPEDPLQTTFTRFKGPAAQKTFVVSHGIDKTSNLVEQKKNAQNHWVGYELDRSIFALTNKSTAPPLTTDTELIWDITRIDDTSVKAELRIAEYLNAQSDVLYFNAKNRAVSLQDYTLEFTLKKNQVE